MNSDQKTARTDAIASLNDEIRRTGNGGRIVVTDGVHNLPSFDARAVINAIATYDEFDQDNDFYGERDFGKFQLFGVTLMWKIDYYDLKLEAHSIDPADPRKTVRILTVLLPSEY